MDDGDFDWVCSLPLAPSGGGDTVGAYVVSAGDGAGELSDYESRNER